MFFSQVDFDRHACLNICKFLTVVVDPCLNAFHIDHNINFMVRKKKFSTVGRLHNIIFTKKKMTMRLISLDSNTILRSQN